MQITDFGGAIRSKTRVNILKILAQRNLRAIDVFSEYKKRYSDESKHRESIYKELEILVNLGIVDKKYDIESKSLVYSLKTQTVKVDLLNSNLSFEK